MHALAISVVNLRHDTRKVTTQDSQDLWRPEQQCDRFCLKLAKSNHAHDFILHGFTWLVESLMSQEVAEHLAI